MVGGIIFTSTPYLLLLILFYIQYNVIWVLSNIAGYFNEYKSHRESNQFYADQTKMFVFKNKRRIEKSKIFPPTRARTRNIEPHTKSVYLTIILRGYLTWHYNFYLSSNPTQLTPHHHISIMYGPTFLIIIYIERYPL